MIASNDNINNYNYEVLKNNESSAMVRELLQIMTSRAVQGGARRSKHEPIPGDLSGRNWSAGAPRFSKNGCVYTWGKPE